jgi:hypothetical protein
MSAGFLVIIAASFAVAGLALVAIAAFERRGENIPAPNMRLKADPRPA